VLCLVLTRCDEPGSEQGSTETGQDERPPEKREAPTHERRRSLEN